MGILTIPKNDASEILRDIGDASNSIKGSIYGIIGNPVTYSISSYLDFLYSYLLTSTSKETGECQIFTKAITNAANANTITIATITGNPCLIESVIIHSDGSTTSDLTNISICGGDLTKNITFINSTDGVLANINAQGKQISYIGSVYMPVGYTINAVLTGTGSTAVDLNAVIKYRSTVDGGYLA